MLVDLHAEALAEAGEAAVWHDEQVPGLGHEFTDALERGLATIAERPDAWPMSAQATASGSTLRIDNLPRCPFSVVDLRKPDRIHVVAVAHQRRRPTCWVDRLEAEASRRTHEGPPALGAHGGATRTSKVAPHLART